MRVMVCHIYPGVYCLKGQDAARNAGVSLAVIVETRQGCREKSFTLDPCGVSWLVMARVQLYSARLLCSG